MATKKQVNKVKKEIGLPLYEKHAYGARKRALKMKYRSKYKVVEEEVKPKKTRKKKVEEPVVEQVETTEKKTTKKKATKKEVK